MNVGERIAIAMKKTGYSQNRLAKAAQISQSGLSSIISGAVSPKEVTLQAIAKALGCSVAELMGESGTSFIPLNNSIPIIGNIACSPQTAPDTNPDGFANIPEGVRADFALRCNGDSMAPLFNDGDLVLIRQQPEVENGQIGAVGINGETTLKHVYRQEDGLLLCANNPKYAPIRATPGDDITIFGLAVGYVRMFY